MISNEIIEIIKIFAHTYAEKGYLTSLKSDSSTNKHELFVSMGEKSVTIRDGYRHGKVTDNRPIVLTSFDILFQVQEDIFLNYISDYPLKEYSRSSKRRLK